MIASVALLATLLTVAPPPRAEWLGTIPAAQVQRIVSLAPSWTEVLYALDAGDAVVGVTRYDDYPKDVLQKPKVGGFVDADAEAVLAQKPQMVLTAPVSGARGRYEALARLGVPVLLLPAERLDDLWTGIRYLGELTGRVDRATTLVSTLSRELAAIEAETRGKPKTRALLLVGYKPIVAAGPKSFYDALLPGLAAENVVLHGQPFTHMDLEAIAAAKPDVIIDLTMGEEAPRNLWSSLDAVMAKPPRVVRIADAATLRLGPRLPDGLRALAKALHP